MRELQPEDDVHRDLMVASAGPAVAQPWQTQATLRASAGTRSITSGEMLASKHQQVFAPSAIPQALPLPHSGQRRGSTGLGSDIRLL
jgi:hypothetical protein